MHGCMHAHESTAPVRGMVVSDIWYMIFIVDLGNKHVFVERASGPGFPPGTPKAGLKVPGWLKNRD
jgi:hypothetical protein